MIGRRIGLHGLVDAFVNHLRAELPHSLSAGPPRVLKRERGNGGDGVWKVALAEPVWARYDPPFMPWFLRRNEILIEIREPIATTPEASDGSST